MIARTFASSLLGFTALTMFSTGTAASAQEVIRPVTPGGATIGQPAESEARRTSDEKAAMAPVGARIGGLTVHPKATVALAYDDNIYSLENKTDDIVVRTSPSVAVDGEFDLYKVTVTAGLDRINFLDNKTENRTDYRISGRHRYDFAEKTYVQLTGAYSRNHEDRGDPNATTTNVSPALFKRYDVGFDAARELARLKAGLRVTYNYYNFYDALQQGGAITNNDDRDRADFRAEGRLGYEFSPGYSVITRFAYDTVRYRLKVDDSGFDRESNGYRIGGGVAFELSRVLTGEVTAGYLYRNYKDPRFPNTSRLAFNASLDWYPTELTSVNFTADRNAQETVAPGYRNYILTSAQVRVEHELLRTLKINASARYLVNDYQRNNTIVVPARQEKYYGAAIGVRYDLNRNFYAVVGYDWNKKTSTATAIGSAFSRNKIALTLGAQF